MKPILTRLRLGDVVKAKVAEILDPQEFIASFDGDLIRVKNLSQRVLQQGESVSLRVQAIKPLAFQIVERRTGPPYWA